MSLRAMIWAFDREMFSSSDKFVLVALANFTSDTGKAYPGVESLASMTGLDRKTVILAIQRLIKKGYISDSGERAGATGKIVVYQFPIEASEKIPKTVSLKSSNSPSMVDQQSFNGGVMVPKTESAIIKEQGTGNREQAPSAKIVEEMELPQHLRIEAFVIAWEKWREVRKAMKKPKCSWTEFFNDQLAWLGTFPENVATSILKTSTINRWTGLFEQRGTTNSHVNGNSRPRSQYDLNQQIEALDRTMEEIRDQHRVIRDNIKTNDVDPEGIAKLKVVRDKKRALEQQKLEAA